MYDDVFVAIMMTAGIASRSMFCVCLIIQYHVSEGGMKTCKQRLHMPYTRSWCVDLCDDGVGNDDRLCAITGGTHPDTHHRCNVCFDKSEGSYVIVCNTSNMR